MTNIQVDSKNVIIITKFWMGVIVAVFTFAVSMVGYIWTSHADITQRNSKDINELKINHYSTLDVMNRLHPEADVTDLYDRARMRYYTQNVRGKKE